MSQTISQDRRRFQSTPPREGGDLGEMVVFVYDAHDFNPRPPRGGQRFSPPPAASRSPISIHAPREGGDDIQHGAVLGVHQFQSTRPAADDRFQSTPPARGATVGRLAQNPRRRYFNPRPPRGGRLEGAGCAAVYRDFNPRPPRGGRPQAGRTAATITRISIHAPREGGDFITAAPPMQPITISIHAPREGGDPAR